MEENEIERTLAQGPRLTVKELRKALRGLKPNMPVVMQYSDTRHVRPEAYRPDYNIHLVFGVTKIKDRAILIDSHGSDHVPIKPFRKMPKWARTVIENMRRRGACNDIYTIMDRVVNEGGTATRLPSTKDTWKQRRGDWVRSQSRPEDWPPVYRRFFWYPLELRDWSRRMRAEKAHRKEQERLQAEADQRLAEALQREHDLQDEERRRRWDLATS